MVHKNVIIGLGFAPHARGLSTGSCCIDACVGFSAVVVDFVAESRGFGGLRGIYCDFRVESLDVTHSCRYRTGGVPSGLLENGGIPMISASYSGDGCAVGA